MSGERLLFIGADNMVARAVRGALESAVSFLQIESLADGGAGTGEKFQPSGILIDSDAHSGVTTAFERIAAAKRQFPAVPIIAMGNEMSAQLVLAAMRAGADDFIDREAAPEELQAMLRSRLSAPAPGHAPARARAAAILSGVPSEQDRDFALNLAVRAAKRAPDAMTLYIDLSLPATEAGIALGLDLKFGVADALREIARLDRAFLESAVARCTRSGLYVMALSADFGVLPEIPDAPAIAGLVAILQSLCDTVIIGYGGFTQPLPESAEIFLCCNQRFPSIRAAGELLRVLRADKRTPQLVIHQLAAGAAPTPCDIRKVLNAVDSIDMDAAWGDLAGHLNDASPLALGGSARYAHALDSCLARMGLAPQAAQPGLKAMLSRWLHPADVS